MGSYLKFQFQMSRMICTCFLLLISFSWLGNNFCSASLFGADASLGSNIGNSGGSVNAGLGVGNNGIDGGGDAGANVKVDKSGSGGFFSNLFGSGSAPAPDRSGGSLNKGLSAGADLHAGGSLDGNLLGVNGHKDVDVNLGASISKGKLADDNIIIYNAPPPTTPPPTTTTCAPELKTSPKPQFPPPPHYNQRPISPRFKGHDC